MQMKSLRELVLPIALSLAAILLTSLILVEAHSLLSFLHVWRDPEDLALAYLLPTIFIAVFFGSTIAVMSSFASGLAAAYFIYPPQFRVMIDDPEQVAELGFIIVLAITASKAVAVITNDKPLVRSAFRCKRTWPRGSLMKLDLRSPHSLPYDSRLNFQLKNSRAVVFSAGDLRLLYGCNR
jgi:K+-sensing histidine kinase KdpD